MTPKNPNRHRVFALSRLNGIRCSISGRLLNSTCAIRRIVGSASIGGDGYSALKIVWYAWPVLCLYGCEDRGALMVTQKPNVDSFTQFAVAIEANLRHALIAACGGDRGREVAVEALTYGWEHWRLSEDGQPGGISLCRGSEAESSASAIGTDVHRSAARRTEHRTSSPACPLPWRHSQSVSGLLWSWCIRFNGA